MSATVKILVCDSKLGWEFICLVGKAGDNNLNLRNIAKKLDSMSSYITRLSSLLEKNNLIKKHRRGRDALVSLTREGHELYDIISQTEIKVKEVMKDG